MATDQTYIIFYMPGGRFLVSKISEPKRKRFHNLLIKEWGEIIPKVASGETWSNFRWNKPIFKEDTPYDARSLTLNWCTGQMFARVTRFKDDIITLHPTEIYMVYGDSVRFYKEPSFDSYKAEGYFLSEFKIPKNK